MNQELITNAVKEAIEWASNRGERNKAYINKKRTKAIEELDIPNSYRLIDKLRDGITLDGNSYYYADQDNFMTFIMAHEYLDIELLLKHEIITPIISTVSYDGPRAEKNIVMTKNGIKDLPRGTLLITQDLIDLINKTTESFKEDVNRDKGVEVRKGIIRKLLPRVIERLNRNGEIVKELTNRMKSGGLKILTLDDLQNVDWKDRGPYLYIDIDSVIQFQDSKRTDIFELDNYTYLKNHENIVVGLMIMIPNGRRIIDFRNRFIIIQTNDKNRAIQIALDYWDDLYHDINRKVNSMKM